MVCLHILGLFIVIVLSVALPAISHKRKHGQAVPPKPRFVGVFSEDHDRDGIAARLKHWSPKDKENAWELSGLYEGDIMIHPEGAFRNGLLDADTRWPGGAVPYYIETDFYTQDEIRVIENALDEYRNKTCIRFRPYEAYDKDYVTIRGSKSGCWSMLGRHGQGQVVNIQAPGCVDHGVVIHVMMHALGFDHQHNVPDRDDWVKIHWENIDEGKRSNFGKHNDGYVTDFGIGYDYKSITHCSDHAFSKNGKFTVTPKERGVKIGLSHSLSEKDIAKLEEMYKEECDGPEPLGSDSGAESAGGDSSGEVVGGDSSEEPVGSDSSEEPVGGDSSEEPVGGDSSEEPVRHRCSNH